MSDTKERPAETETEEGDIEARARLMGWRPLDEFRGPAGAWKSAEEFVRRGEEDLPLVREHNRRLEQRLMKTEREVTDSRETIEHMAGMMRTSEERAYKRAKAELEAQREAAVASGDVQAFKAAEREMQALQNEAPKPPPPKTPAAQTEPAPEALAWADQNPWFKTDRILHQEAHAVHQRLLQAEPGLSLTQNLDRVTRTIRAMFPEKFRSVEQDGHVVDDNPRRERASSVAASSPNGGPKTPKARSFDAMPPASKEAFTKYANQFKNAGKRALTKEEWAETYWGPEE